jgi:DNA primase
MGECLRDRLPDPVAYFDSEGVSLKGPGRWKSGPCGFHGGSDSLRVNVQSGAWRCMNCGAKGGDVLAYAMQMHGLDFVAAARALGAYADDGQPHSRPAQAATLTPRDAMQLAALEVMVALSVIGDIRRGVIPNDDNWQRCLVSASRLHLLVEEYQA